MASVKIPMLHTRARAHTHTHTNTHARTRNSVNGGRKEHGHKTEVHRGGIRRRESLVS